MFMIHLWRYVNWALLWSEWLKIEIAQQLLMDVSHVQFQQNLWNGLYMKKYIYGLVQSGLSISQYG